MDSIDRRIIELLEGNARISNAELARQLGLSGPSAYARVRKLEEAGVIRGYTVRVDPAVLGLPIAAFVRISTRPFAGESEQARFEAGLVNEKRVVECHDVVGEDSYLVKVRCESLSDLRALVAEIRALPAVERTVTAISMSRLKDSDVCTGLGPDGD